MERIQCVLTQGEGPQYCLAILGFKVSLLASYLRVAGFNRTYAIALYFCIALVTVSQLVFTVLHAASCSPVAMRTSAAKLCIHESADLIVSCRMG